MVRAADLFRMGRSPVWLCGVMGMVVGGFVPALWGASSFSLSSFLFSVLGGFAGAWFGWRLSEG